jgi:hypothetical protein
MRPRNHARRPRFALPAGIDLADFDFRPDKYECLVDRLREMKLTWQREDDARRRQRAKQVEAEIEADRRKQAVEDERDAIAREHDEELARVRYYWIKQQQIGKAQMDKLIAQYEAQLNSKHTARLKKLAEITKEIEQDRIRAEKKALLHKGIVRGRK